MLYLSHSFVIGPLFLQLILPIALSYCGVDMALCKWVEYPHVKKCTLPISTPKTLRYYVEVGSVFKVGCSASIKIAYTYIPGNAIINPRCACAQRGL